MSVVVNPSRPELFESALRYGQEFGWPILPLRMECDGKDGK